MRGKQLFLSLLLLFLSMAFTLVAIECLVRLFVISMTPNVIALDPELGWRHRSNIRRNYYVEGIVAEVETNELGMRGPLYVGPSQHRRVLILGDSFADGLEVSNNQLFSIIWNRKVKGSLEIVNAGLGGYGTLQETLLFRRLEPVIQPDIVVLMTFANDLTDNVMPVYNGIGPRPYIDQEGRFRPLSWESFDPLLLPIPGAAWLHRNSLAAYLIRNRMWSKFYANQTRPYIQGLKRAVPESVKWRIFETLVTSLAKNREFFLVALPTRGDVTSNRWDFTLRLRDLADRLDIEFVNLQVALRPEHFYEKDIHWNPRGHRAVACYLSSMIN